MGNQVKSVRCLLAGIGHGWLHCIGHALLPNAPRRTLGEVRIRNPEIILKVALEWGNSGTRYLTLDVKTTMILFKFHSNNEIPTEKLTSTNLTSRSGLCKLTSLSPCTSFSTSTSGEGNLPNSVLLWDGWDGCSAGPGSATGICKIEYSFGTFSLDVEHGQ